MNVNGSPTTNSASACVAIVAMAGAISSARQISDGDTSIPRGLAALRTMSISIVEVGLLPLNKTASRRRPGTISRSSSNRLPASSFD